MLIGGVDSVIFLVKSITVKSFYRYHDGNTFFLYFSSPPPPSGIHYVLFLHIALNNTVKIKLR